MLEHLGAQDEIERRVVDGERLDGADQVGVRVLDDVHSDVHTSDRGEERLVGLHAATDV